MTRESAPASRPSPLDEPILIGASWYPEMWEPAEWPKDTARMRDLGFRIVRLFEFAWKRFEPKEGVFDFDWAREVLDLCHGAGIAVMIGTPTAAPPAWLTEKYPEVLLTGPDGRRAVHGKRKHYNHHSRVYRRHCARIVRAMAENLGTHPAVHSWQIDNEMSGSDYGEETRALFHAWLEKRFGTVEALNEAWGLHFWSQAYDHFGQIPMVESRVGSIEVPERHHPSLLIAQARFQNDGWTEFIDAQCRIIREHSDRPITSNMTENPGMHWYQHNRVLDAVGTSCYKDLAHYTWTLFTFDRMRAEKARPYWLLETAPSWSAGGRIWNIHMHGDGIRAFSWLSLLMGGSMILYWQWRQHWAGQEMLHGTLVTATGAWRPGVDAHRRLTGEVAEHEEWLRANPPAPAAVALLYSNETAWALSIDPHDDGVVYNKLWRDDFHLPLVENHIHRDVIAEDADLSPYRVLIVPLLHFMKAGTTDKLRRWVEGGGRLFLGPMVHTRTEEYTLWKDRAYGGLEDLMGAESLHGFPHKWMEERTTVEGPDLPAAQPKIWGEAFKPHDAEVLARYKGGYGDGQPAVIDHRFGKGRVISCGTFTGRDTYMRLVGRLMEDAGVRADADGDPSVIVVPRAARDGAHTGYGVVNISEAPAAVALAQAGTDRLSGKRFDGPVTLDPLQVALVECGPRA
ncbi:MAG: beta-galactosidase [Opitutales bacterium]|nr:beta-galactosidase [Opitutales bacterium]